MTTAEDVRRASGDLADCMLAQEYRIRALERHAEKLAALARESLAMESTEEQRQRAARLLAATAMWSPL